MQSIDLIIFDLDGVLVDTDETHRSALCSAVCQVTGLHYDRINHLLTTDGSTTHSKIKTLQSVFGYADAACDEIDRLKQHIILSKLAQLTPNADQILMLSQLSTHHILAVGSNSRQVNVNSILDRLAIRQFFSKIVSTDPDTPAKPDPAIFNRIMCSLNINKDNTLILEDSPTGIEAVNRSGAHLLVTTVETTNLEYINNAIRQIQTNNNCANGRPRL